MKIVAGLGSIDEYIPFVEAGADEFFCGYVPYDWAQKYGNLSPINRREVFYYNVQIGSFSELKILHKMMEEKGVPVKLTFNALYHTAKQYPILAEIISGCMEIGFPTFIIADPALIFYLRKQKINCNIHVSGELSEVNSPMIEVFETADISRIIFHRKNSIADMKSCIQKARQREGGVKRPLEFEAFALNEMCHFSGAFCNSFHCDELCHLCRAPYRLGNLSESGRIQEGEPKLEIPEDEMPEDMEGYLTGETGCGLCSLYALKEAGITHLKLVGRGNYTEYMKRDIQKLRQALAILEEVKETGQKEEDYIRQMKQQLFEKGCSGNCYYI